MWRRLKKTHFDSLKPSPHPSGRIFFRTGVISRYRWRTRHPKTKFRGDLNSQSQSLPKEISLTYCGNCLGTSFGPDKWKSYCIEQRKIRVRGSKSIGKNPHTGERS